MFAVCKSPAGNATPTIAAVKAMTWNERRQLAATPSQTENQQLVIDPVFIANIMILSNPSKDELEVYLPIRRRESLTFAARRPFEG